MSAGWINWMLHVHGLAITGMNDSLTCSHTIPVDKCIHTRVYMQSYMHAYAQTDRLLA